METGDQVKFADLPQKLHITSQPSLWEEEIHELKGTLQVSFLLLLCLFQKLVQRQPIQSQALSAKLLLFLLLIGSELFPFRQKNH